MCSGNVFLLIKGRQGVEKKSSQEGESVGKKIPNPEPIKDRNQGLFCSSFFLSYLPTARTSKTVPKFHGLRKKIFKEIDKRLSAGWLQPAFTTSGEKRTPQRCCFHVGDKESGNLRLRRGGDSSRPCGGRMAGQQDGRTAGRVPHPWDTRSLAALSQAAPFPWGNKSTLQKE